MAFAARCDFGRAESASSSETFYDKAKCPSADRRGRSCVRLGGSGFAKWRCVILTRILRALRENFACCVCDAQYYDMGNGWRVLCKNVLSLKTELLFLIVLNIDLAQ
ncbi:hypothetical protein T281_08355 [Rhodomicrobium udaipurense JA643]|nr:hypothetical protein T281_08355 [Rhodomicrobium udaipurense JA643]